MSYEERLLDKWVDTTLKGHLPFYTFENLSIWDYKVIYCNGKGRGRGTPGNYNGQTQYNKYLKGKLRYSTDKLKKFAHTLNVDKLPRKSLPQSPEGPSSMHTTTTKQLIATKTLSGNKLHSLIEEKMVKVKKERLNQFWKMCSSNKCFLSKVFENKVYK